MEITPEVFTLIGMFVLLPLACFLPTILEEYCTGSLLSPVFTQTMKARLPQGYGSNAQNMNSMIKQAQKMQEEMEKAQEEIKAKEYSTTVGGGVVEITMTGDKILKSITLKPEVVDPEDIETLQDLIVSGVNEVLRQVESETEEKMNAISGGLNIPGLF